MRLDFIIYRVGTIILRWDVAKSMSVDVVGLGLGIATGIGVGALGLTFSPAVIVLGVTGFTIAGLGYVAKKGLGVN